MSITVIFAYIIFFGVLLYLLLILPQKRRARAQERMLSGMKVGDKVVTVGGIFGEVRANDGETVELEVAEGVTIKIASKAVGQIVPAEEALGSDLKAS